MTQFRVLPVRRGDAYYLKSARGGYLVDGGAYGCGVPDMLNDRKVPKLRAAICTCTCKERLGGILEMLESERSIGEYWFPERLEVLAEMARRFSGDWQGWLHQLNGNTGDQPTTFDGSGWTGFVRMLPQDEKRRRLEGCAVLLGLAMTACLGWSPYALVSRSIFHGTESRDPLSGLAKFFGSTLEMLADRAATRWRKQKTPMNRIIRRMGWRLYHGGEPEDMAVLCGRLLMAEAKLLPGGNERGIKAVVQGLAMTAMTSALMAKSSARFRFFRHIGRLKETLVSHHPMQCLNGVEVSPLTGLAPTASPRMILQQVRQFIARKDGLVFRYGDARCGVLFCGDTRMNFLDKNEVIQLDRPTIIAAPRQGSCSSDRAYAHIVSNNPRQDIWVRTFLTNAQKVSPYYKKRLNKVCLNNCQTQTVQEILLEFEDTSWTRKSGGQCVFG